MIRRLLNRRHNIEAVRRWITAMVRRDEVKQNAAPTHRTPPDGNLLNIPIAHGKHILQWRGDCLLFDGAQHHLMIEGSGYMGEGDLLDVSRVKREGETLHVAASSYGKAVTLVLDPPSLDALVHDLDAHKPHTLVSTEGIAIECSWL